MKYAPERRRRSIRLKGYDYSQPGAYFVTICTHERRCLFGDVVDGEMRLNELGKIARQCWLAIPEHFPHARLDEFVIMPNHVHGIIWIVDEVDAENIVRGEKFFAPTIPTIPWHIQDHRVYYPWIQNWRYQMGTATHRRAHPLAPQLL